ncbi:MAG: hypothetical protein QM635_02740 [Microbacteriaceae bacterium]
MTDITALRQPPTDRFEIFTPDFDAIVAEGDAAMKGWLPPRSGMRRFAAPADRSMRSGFSVFGPNVSGKVSYWMKEVWYVIEGSATLEIEDLVTGTATSHRVAAGDAVYFPEAVRLNLITGGERLVLFYSATPASGRDAPWIAALGQFDIDDARKRLAYESGAD